jgi:ribosomal subunit interface protein
MNITIKATNIDMTPSIDSYIREKLSSVTRVLKERGDSEALVQVDVGKTTDHHRQGDIFRAEINLFISGDTHRTEHSSGDLYSSIDVAKDALVDSLAKRKDKKVGMFRKGARMIKGLVRGE